MPNVLGLVSFRIFPTQMGGQKGVALFYKYLQQHFNIVLATSADNQKGEETKTVNLLYSNKKIYLNYFKLNQLKKIIRQNHIDVVIAEHSYTGWIGWLLYKATGIPFIIHSHNIESRRFHQMHKWWWKFYHHYEGWIYRKAHHNFFISNNDLSFALKEFNLSGAKCSVVTYGVESKPVVADKRLSRTRSGLDKNKTILLFNGTLDYQPNYRAVEVLINRIEPLLRKRLNQYEIIITGNRAPKKLIEKILSNQNINFIGYADDINLLYQSADLFINPVSNNTGVKTKLIEAIANNCTAISTESGASGIRKELCGDKLVTVADNDWNGFVDGIIEHLHKPSTQTPQSFYDCYLWINIALQATEKINEVVHQ